MRSYETWTEQLAGLLRTCVPVILILIMLGLNIIAMTYPFIGTIKAPLFLMVIYYWSIYRPTLIPPWFVFAAGLIMDILGGLPLGLNAIAFVGTHWLVAEQRRFLMSQSFSLIWLGFGILCFGVAAFQWSVFNLLNLQIIPFDSFIYSSVLGIAIFPLICVLLHLTHKVLPDPGPSLSLRSQGR